MNYLFYLYLAMTIFFEISAQYIFKLYHKYSANKKINSYYYPYIGVIFYAITGIFAFKLLNYGELGVINIIWHLFHFFFLFFIGYYFLNEKLSTKKIIGSILGLTALFILMSDVHLNDNIGHH